MPRALGVLTVEEEEGGTARPLFEVGGPRLGSGPRFGRGPVVGTRMDCVDVELLGRGRRLEAATWGGGMRDVVGLGGGAMSVGLLGGGMAD